MSLAWSGDFSQSREDELERAMEREDRRAMIDPVWEVSLNEDPADTPAQRNFANWNADLADHELLHVEPIRVYPKISSTW